MNTLTTQSQNTALEVFGAFANDAAARSAFRLYQDRRPANTQRAQRAALAVFEAFLRTGGIVPTGELYSDPDAWQGITWGTLQAFQVWQLQQGYAVGTVNGRVSTVRFYMGLANQAGAIPDGEVLRAGQVKGYTRKEAMDTDAKRAKQGTPTRKGLKKSQAVTITEDQARKLCQVRNETPQARRDALMLCLFVFHGLRVSEVAGLQVKNVDTENRMITFYRPKTGKESRHRIRGRAWQCLTAYLKADHPGSDALLLASTKTGALLPGSDMSIEAIRQRVTMLGQGIGIDHLTPHDLRHHGATVIANDPNSSLGALMSWGGWESASSASRYIEAGAADNDGVSLGMED